MAKSTLPVNYQDDILNSAMSGKRRFKLINNSDGTVSLDDVTTYDQVGSNFGAGQMNATNQAVNESLDKNKVVRDLATIGAITQAGYVPDALALKEVNDSLVNENSESFNFGVKNGVRGFFTDPSRADDSFIPFRGGGGRGEQITLTLTITGYFTKSNEVGNFNQSVTVSISSVNSNIIVINESTRQNGAIGTSAVTSWVQGTISDVKSHGNYNYTFVLTVTGFGSKDNSSSNYNASINVSVIYENDEFIISNGVIRDTRPIGSSSRESWAQAEVNNAKVII